MSTSENAESHPTQTPPQSVEDALEEVTTVMSSLDVDPSNSDEPPTTANENDEEQSPRPLIVYTREQTLHLSKSPLVKPPDGMPPLKDWFGEVHEHTIKKDIETSGSATTNRDRRYRREADDGDTPNRAPFRSALSQPSQMGNFKHQSLRGSDRERDRERDTERDLRTLSDKYDREKGRVDRLGLPSHSTLLRNRDRETAPHLPASTTNRVVSSGSETLGTTGSRRGEATSKKRNGESSEDWRRGAEPPRSGREDRGDYARRDREDRERPRSRVRDTSRQRASPPLSRRDRERERDRDEKDRDRRGGERDRDWDARRDKDRDRFVDAEDDPRRWRDDGKRDERIAQRRGGDKDKRDKDRGRDRDDRATDKDQENGRDRDGWTVEGDSRGGKRNQRDRRHAADDSKDRDDRREREKEKEPAWMETYVPSASTPGILGGKGEDGEVDSIQAWKKDMKEKEMKDKGLLPDTAKSPSPDEGPADPPVSAQSAPPLDEIQLFKLMMKREEHKRVVKPDEPAEGRATPPEPASAGAEINVPGLMRIRDGRKASGNVLKSTSTGSLADGSENAADSSKASTVSTLPPPSVDSTISNPSPLLATLLGTSQEAHNSLDTPVKTPGHDGLTPRLLPPKSQGDSYDGPPSSTQFDPPRQSRLLAFAKVSSQPQGSKPPAQSQDALWAAQQRGGSPSIQQTSQQGAPATANPQLAPSAGPLDVLSRLGQTSHMKQSARAHESDPSHPARGFSPFENPGASVLSSENSRDLMHYIDTTHSAPLPSTDRMNYASPVDNLPQLTDNRRNPTPPVAGYNNSLPSLDGQAGGLAASNYATGKGSRFAKFFDGKTKDGNVQSMGRAQSASGMGPPISLPSRQENPGYNSAGAVEARNFGDILAMLNNSAQAQRANQLLPPHSAYNQNSSHLLSAQQQQQMLHNQLNHVSSGGRHDPMFDVDDGRFVADGMVPGLRPAPAPRSRESSGGSIYHGQFDEPMQYNAGRLPPQQRNVEQLYSGPLPPQFATQGPGGGRGAIPNFQQPPFRGGPSPISNFNPHQAPQQRLPPGLANLGGRPPHEPSQFMGAVGVGLGIPSQGVHGGLHGNSAQQAYNQFQGGGLGFVGGQQQMRGPPGGLAHLGNPMGGGVNGVAGLNAGVDFRGQAGQPQAQLLGLGGNANAVAMRGGVYNPHHGPGASQVQGGALLGMRQQQQQHQHLPPPHLMQQMLPPQMQPHGLTGAQHNQNDLMALLMGGAHRE